MNNNLKNELETYLGSLISELNDTYDYFDRQKIEAKTQAIETLLEIPIINRIITLEQLLKK